MCVMNRVNIGSDNGLSPIRGQAIIWTNTGLLLIETNNRSGNPCVIFLPFCAGANIHFDCDCFSGVFGPGDLGQPCEFGSIWQPVFFHVCEHNGEHTLRGRTHRISRLKQTLMPGTWVRTLSSLIVIQFTEKEVWSSQILDIYLYRHWWIIAWHVLVEHQQPLHLAKIFSLVQDRILNWWLLQL